VVYDDDRFSEAELAVLIAEPMLVVVEIEGGEIAQSPDFDQMTVKELKALCTRLEIAIPAGAKKTDLIELLKTNTNTPPEL
jgi:hypothetical protein